MNIEKYFREVDGKKIDFDGVYGYQCVDLIKDYESRVLGLIPEAVGDAWQYYADYELKPFLKNHFIRIANTPDFIPEKGDICVFNKNYGQYGHVCIATGEGNVNFFYSYDQNINGKGEAVQKIKHNYVFLYGVLRFKTKKTHLVRVTCDRLNIRKNYGLQSKIVGVVVKNEVFTIIEEKKSDGFTWGKLKSGAGWIALNYTEEV